MKALRAIAATVLAMTMGPAEAAPPAELDYQGKVLVNDLPFTGSGYFKFAIANAAGTTNFWAQDGTGAGEPVAHMTNQVFNGVFSTLLGAAPMTALPPSLFALDTSLYLRVWFGSTNTSFAEMLPAQRVASAPYALNAELLDGYHATGLVAAATNAVTLSGDVSGKVGNVQLQPNSVGSAEIAGNAVGSAAIAPNAVGSSEIADDTIMDADVNTGAGIKGSKIQQGSTTNLGVLQLATGSTGTQAIAAGHPYLRAFGVVNTMTAAAPAGVLTVAGSGGIYVSNQPPSTLLIGVSLPSLDNVIWVATNGTAAGPGSMDRPYDTPQNGYNAAVARYPSQPACVVIAAGTYTGTLAMGAGNVHVAGLERAEIGSLTVGSAQSAFMASKVRVQNLVVLGRAWFPFTTASGVKFYNVKMMGGLWINGSDVEIQNCFITQGADAQFGALRIGDGGATVNTVSLHHCSIYIESATLPALKVEPNVHHLEVLWSEIANTGDGPAIVDGEPGPIVPVHLYAHNWIRGPSPAAGITALNDWAVQQGPTIGFFNNTVLGNVGFANGGAPHAQFYGNNMVFGRINWPGAGAFGWLQAGAGAGADAANNTEHQLEFPALPDSYRD